jgi:hypothetical protein
MTASSCFEFKQKPDCKILVYIPMKTEARYKKIKHIESHLKTNVDWISIPKNKDTGEITYNAILVRTHGSKGFA